HPQQLTHCMKKLTSNEKQRVPVLTGLPIPRADKAEDASKYSAVMLILFKPWSKERQSPLKQKDETWEDAYREFELTVSSYHRRIMDNMQLVYLSRDAKMDYSARRK
ncbi:hypothetical protein FB45DRAFT_669829, partial [Roridomyces roridus]